MCKLDTQQIELLSRSLVEAELIKRGHEVARPARDRGIDLIVYPGDSDADCFFIPLQLICASKQAFRVFRKHEKFRNAIFIYVWQVADNPAFLLMTYAEAIRFVDTKSRYWQEHDNYQWNRVSKEMDAALEPYKGRWNLIEETFARMKSAR